MNKCPYCNEEVRQVPVGLDDSLDYCETCDKVVEGHTV